MQFAIGGVILEEEESLILLFVFDFSLWEPGL
jgi:hypothetical protein